MAEMIAAALLVLIATYAACGLLASASILPRLEKFDDQAIGASLAFRLLLVPGLLVFWPVFVSRMKRGSLQPPEEQNAHRAVQGGAR